jgi:voltage-gated potassium channel
MDEKPELDGEVARERLSLLRQIEELLEGPMLVLSFVWLILFVVEVTAGLNPILEVAGYVIWGLFVVDFVIRFVLAPGKLAYLRVNWLTAISLLVPALRVFRIFGALRLARLARLSATASVARGARLVRVLGTLNRGINALRASMRRRGFIYVAALTIVVALAGAAGMYTFEAGQPGSTLDSYGSALWWTAMVMTTMGTDYWPRTPEGRILCFVLALFAFGVFGYVTAALASFFVGRDAEEDSTQPVSAKTIEALRSEVTLLRDEIRKLNDGRLER